MFGKNLLPVQSLVITILLVAAVPAAANPGYSGGLFTHVRPYDPYAEPIASCSELSLHTTATGWVDFEVYLYQEMGAPPYGVDECSFDFTWPDTWYFDQGWYPIPHGGTGTVDVVGNRASVDVTYPGCPTTQGDLFLLLRLSFWVEGYGELAVVDNNWIGFCYPPGWYGLSYLPGFGGEAGVVCGYDYANCEGSSACQPEALTPLLELLVNQGETVERTLVFQSPGYGCSPDFAVTEPWMSIQVGEPNENHQYPVTLTVDTGELGLGYHEGFVSATDQGVACTLVALTVADLTGVETSSWGRIKSFY